MKKKFTVASIFDRKWVVLIISFFLAVAVWIVVAYTIDTNITRTIRNVPITIDEKEGAYRNFGLHVVSYDPLYVDVEVSGDRTVVNNLTAENLRVVPNYTGVELPGTFTLNLSVSRLNAQQGAALTMTLKQTTVEITFDTEAEETFEVSAKVENFVTADGLIGGTISVTPAEITISGPEGELAKVAEVVAKYDLDGTALSESLTVQTGFTLLDKDGKEVPQDNLVILEEGAEINIPVLKTGVLPLGIEFINVPDGFDISTIEYTLSREEMKVFGPVGIVENLQTKTVGRIDLATFELGKEYVFDVILPDNLSSNDNFDSVTVTFPSGSLSSTKVRVTNFAVDNAPANFNIEILRPAIPNVTVIGPPEEIENLLDTSVVAVLDAADMKLQSGEYEYTVSFSIPSSNSLWVAGKYTVLVSITSS